jgi:hypothetical protein
MDKEQRGRLLADQEEAKKQIEEIINNLSIMGQQLRRLSDAMVSQPENIMFLDAPNDLGEFPDGKTTPYVFPWKQIIEISDIRKIAELIRDLRRLKHKILDVSQTLQP